MAYDKVIDSSALEANLTSVANAIRSKGGTSGNLAFPSGFVSAIEAIASGGSVSEGNIRTFTSTLATTVTSGNATLVPANDFLKSIRTDPNAFVILWYTSPTASTSMANMWINANFTLLYYGTSAKNTVLLRSSTSAGSVTTNTNGVKGVNYAGHISVETDGSIQVRGIGSGYDAKAGTYRVICGTI